MIKKIIIIVVLLILFKIDASYADTLKEIKVTGNDRISKETIVLFSGVNINDDLDENNLNQIIKELYETSFFKNISINFNESILYIDVVENPLIQSVIFKGIKNKSLVANIKKVILQKEKSSFVESKIKDDQNRIINSLRIIGYYFSEIETSIKKNQNNTVDIIYDVNLGNKAQIKKIKFIGNKVFKDNKLRKVIISEESKFWKFISTKKKYRC